MRRARRSPRRWSVVVASCLLLLGACGSEDASEPSTDPDALEGELTVAAASSLTDVFADLGEDFEAEHPGTTITFTFDSSGTLANQIVEGAPVDLFAAADEESMAVVADAGLLADEPRNFAGNLLVIVTKAGNPSGFEPGPGSLAEVDVLAMCAETAPCGRIAAERLGGLGLDEQRITRAPNARATLSAVVEGDADVGIVFATDALAAGDRVETFELGMDEQRPDTLYPLAVVAGTDDAALAEAFAAFVLSDAGQARLADAGFMWTS